MADELLLVRGVPWNVNKLIATEVKKYPCIWDPRCVFYCDRKKNKEAWLAISELLNVNESFVKTRWRTLRDRFVRATRNQLRGISDQWNLKPYLDFLEKTVVSKQAGKKFVFVYASNAESPKSTTFNASFDEDSQEDSISRCDRVGPDSINDNSDSHSNIIHFSSENNDVDCIEFNMEGLDRKVKSPNIESAHTTNFEEHDLREEEPHVLDHNYHIWEGVQYMEFPDDNSVATESEPVVQLEPHQQLESQLRLEPQPHLEPPLHPHLVPKVDKVALKSAMKDDFSSKQESSVEHFCKSLIEPLSSFSDQKREEAKIKIMTLLYEMRYGKAS